MRKPGLKRLWSHSRNTVGLDKPTVFRAHRFRPAQHSDSHERSSGNCQKWGAMAGDLTLASVVAIWVISLSSALEAEQLSPTAHRDMGSVPFPPSLPGPLDLASACASAGAAESADLPAPAPPGAVRSCERRAAPRRPSAPRTGAAAPPFSLSAVCQQPPRLFEGAEQRNLFPPKPFNYCKNRRPSTTVIQLDNHE